MKIDRLVGIIMLLLEKERISAQELAEQFEVSPRTIYRDIDAVSMAGIPVRSAPGVGGGFEIMPQYEVDKKIFSNADLSAILMGLSGLSNMIRGNALAKVKCFIATERTNDIEVKANQVYIYLSYWMGNQSIQSHLEMLKTSVPADKAELNGRSFYTGG